MTVPNEALAAQPALSGKKRSARRMLRQRFALLVLPALFAALFAAWAPTALAEPIHVSASADPKQSATQARQQALERALVEAVYQEALRMLPAPQAIATERLGALRAHLAPHALDYVQSYQEANPAPPDQAQADQNGEAREQPRGSAQNAAPQALVLELDVTVQRAYLRSTLVNLGFFAGARHPGAYVLRLGPGVKEKDFQPLAAEGVLLGLARMKQAAPGADHVEVALERLPQGYYKAVLRQQDLVLAADASELPALWLDIWAKYFSDSRLQPGPGKMSLTIAGFASVDAVQDFVRVLAAWDEAVQAPTLAGMDLGADGVSAQFTCRVINQEALDARLREALPVRKLTLVGQAGGNAGAAQAGTGAP